MTSLTVQETSYAADINAAGQVVGDSTYVYFVPEGGCTPDYPYYPNCGGHWEYETNSVLWENGVGSYLTNSSDRRQWPSPTTTPGKWPATSV